MQSWIEEAMSGLGLHDPQYLWWLNHRFMTFKKDPAVAWKLGHELSRATVEKYGPEIDGFRDKVGEDYTISEHLRDQFYADFNAMGAAYDLLQKFQQKVRLEYRQGTIPFPSPAPAPIMGPEAELGLSGKQEVGDPAVEITDRIETATEPETESSETSEATSESDQSNDETFVTVALFVQNQSGALRRASDEEVAWNLITRCQASYERLRTQTDPSTIADELHAQRLATQWAAEIQVDEEIRYQLDAVLVRSLRRLGQIRALFRKNGQLKKGKGSKQLFVKLDKHTLQQSDKLAKIEEDDDFEARLRKKIQDRELTRYSTLENPPAPKPQPKWIWLYRAFNEVIDNAKDCAEGRYMDEDKAAWAELRGHYSELRSFAVKLKELLDLEIQ